MLGGWGRRAALAAVLGLGYAAYVVRVGGDFMFGRLLIPATPFFLMLLELGVARVASGRPRAQLLAAVAAVAAVALTPYPFRGEGWVHGIVNEPAFYSPGRTAETRAHGLILRRYFEGLPVRVAFLGSEARLVYYARPAVAIECQTGLTDRFIARQPLRERGRVGHEKRAPLGYLIGERHAHFAFHPLARRELGLDGWIPAQEIELDGVTGQVLTWDPALMDSLRRRGARFEDFPARLDRFLEQLPRVPDADVRMVYAGLRRFYFVGGSDPRREQPFIERLKRGAPGSLPGAPTGTEAPGPPRR
jgi:hypothetical protein